MLPSYSDKEDGEGRRAEGARINNLASCLSSAPMPQNQTSESNFRQGLSGCQYSASIPSFAGSPCPSLKQLHGRDQVKSPTTLPPPPPPSLASLLPSREPFQSEVGTARMRKKRAFPPESRVATGADADDEGVTLTDTLRCLDGRGFSASCCAVRERECASWFHSSLGCRSSR